MARTPGTVIRWATMKGLLAITGQLGLALRYSRLMHAMQSIEDVIDLCGDRLRGVDRNRVRF